METYELIRRAILNRRQVIAVYGGHLRRMCPHKLGTKDGVAHGLFYQFGGTSESPLEGPGSPRNWRCMEIAGLSDVSSADGPWHSAPLTPDHPHQHCIDVVDVVVPWTPSQDATEPAVPQG